MLGIHHDKDLLHTLIDMQPEEFGRFKQHLRRVGMTEASQAITPQHLAAKSVYKGSGFQKAVKSSLSIFNPLAVGRTVSQVHKSFKQKKKMTPLEQQFAQLAQDSYKDQGDRQGEKEGGLHGWKIEHKFTDDRHVVYTRGNQHVMAYRGTADSKDLLPDLNIVAGTQDKSKAFKDAKSNFEAAQKALGGQWQTTGHSLGGTKAMWVAQQHGIHSYAFNPGFHSFSDDRVDTDYKKHHVFIIKGDPVSNSITSRNNADLHVFSAASKNPLKNHSMSNFIDPSKVDNSIPIPQEFRKSSRFIPKTAQALKVQDRINIPPPDPNSRSQISNQT